MKIRRKEDIKGNLYTRGGLFQVYDAGNKVQKINTYVGPYHLKNNVAYEGAEPRRGAKKLRKIVRNQNIFTYNKLNSDYAKRFTFFIKKKRHAICCSTKFTQVLKIHHYWVFSWV